MRRLRDTFTRSIAWTAGRILTALALAAALAYFGMGEAKASVDGDAGMAFRHCHASGAAKVAKFNDSHRAESYTCTLNVNSTANTGSYQCNAKIVRKSDNFVQYTEGTCSLTTFSYSSGTGGTDKHSYTSSCSSRADLGGLTQTNFSDGGKICNFGCEYDQTQPQVDTTITDNSSPANSIRFGILLGGKANGAVCQRPDGKDKPPAKGEEPPPCLVVGTDSHGDIKHCPQEDGRSCIISGRGTKFCQPPPPNTEGPKVDTGRQDANSQSASPNSPPQAPAPRPGESWAPGPGSTVCNNITGACSQSNTYVNNGTPNVNGTPITGDGSGTNGTGQQEGSAGTGTGTGSGTSTDMGPTNALLGDIKGLLGSEGQADTTFEGQIDGAFAGENDVPDNDEHADPTDGIKQIRDGNWLTDQLDDAGFLGAGQCPADIQVNVGTTSIPLTFGPICQLLSAVSGLVMAAAYLIAFRIMAA